MSNFKIKVIAILLIILNIFSGSVCYKFYASNKMKTAYIERQLNGKINDLKSCIESSIYYLDDFSENNCGHVSRIKELDGITRYMESILDYLGDISFFLKLRYDGAGPKESYSDLLWKMYSGFLTHDYIEIKDKFIYFNKEQMDYLQEVNNLIKDYKEKISQVPDDVTLYSEDWIEFVNYFMHR